MKKHFQIILTLTLIFVFKVHESYGQGKVIQYRNDLNAYYSQTRPNDTLNDSRRFRFYEPKINEINLNPNATFEFWSRPSVSCFTWRSYKGSWIKNNDTLLFYDNYQVNENDRKLFFEKDSRQEFVITIKTDKGSVLKNRNIKIEYIYDYEAHIDRPSIIFTLDENNSVIIPFKNIPYFDKLASFRMEYLLNFVDKRYCYLTENKKVNVKNGDISNVIDVELVERPKKEIVYRTVKAVVKNDSLKIISCSKTKSILPDYYRDIEFEDIYILNK